MTPHAVGIDVGGTTIKAGLVAADGRILASVTEATPHDAAQVIALALACYEHLTASRQPGVPVGIVVPGVVDEARCRGVLSANLGWRDVDFGALIRAAFAPRAPGIAWAFGHDVRAGLLAEMTFGVAQGSESVIFVPIGTGISAAIAIDGHPLVGGGYAGEIGHVQVDPAGEACGCGGRGCLETVASARAIAQAYTRRAGTPAEGARDVFAARAAGDPVADEVISGALASLGSVLAQVITVLGPAQVVIGGGLALAGESLAGELLSHIELPFTPLPRVSITALGDRAAVLGAAVLARRVAGL